MVDSLELVKVNLKQILQIKICYGFVPNKTANILHLTHPWCVNTLSANLTTWSNTLKKFVGNSQRIV